MSGRGGGRGRGRGRGMPPQTGGMMFLRRSAEECGLDSRNLRSLQDITRPPLFPPIELHSGGRPPPSPAALAAKAAAAAAAAAAKEKEKDKSENGGKDADKDKDKDNEKEKEKAQAKPPPPEEVDLESTSTDKKKKAPQQLSISKRTPTTLYLISKSRELHHRMQSSVYYVRPSKDIPDVVRYSDTKRHLSSNSNSSKKRASTGGEAEDAAHKRRNLDASNVLRYCLGGRASTSRGRFLPEELLSGQKLHASLLLAASGATSSDGKPLTLEELEAKERRRRARGGAESSDDEKEGGEEAPNPYADQEDEEEMEEMEDYMVNHYESEGESDGRGGEDEEPTF